MARGLVRSRLVGGLLRALRVCLFTWSLLPLVTWDVCALPFNCGGTHTRAQESQISTQACSVF